MSIIENIKLQLGEGPVPPKKKKPDKFIDTMAEMDAAIAKMVKASAKTEFALAKHHKVQPKQPIITITAKAAGTADQMITPGADVKVVLQDGSTHGGVLTDVEWLGNVSDGLTVQYFGRLMEQQANTFSGKTSMPLKTMAPGDTLTLPVQHMNVTAYTAQYNTGWGNAELSSWDNPLAKKHADADLTQITADLEKLEEPKGTQGVPAYSIGGSLKWGDPKMSLQAYQHQWFLEATKPVDPEKALTDAFTKFMKEVQHGFSTGKFKFPAGEHALGAMTVIPSSKSYDLSDPLDTKFKQISLTLKEE